MTDKPIYAAFMNGKLVLKNRGIPHLYGTSDGGKYSFKDIREVVVVEKT